MAVAALAFGAGNSRCLLSICMTPENGRYPAINRWRGLTALLLGRVKFAGQPHYVGGN